VLDRVMARFKPRRAGIVLDSDDFVVDKSHNMRMPGVCRDPVNLIRCFASAKHNLGFHPGAMRTGRVRAS